MTTQPKHLTAAEKVILKAANPEMYAFEIAEAANVSVELVYRTVRKFDIEIMKFKGSITDEQKQMIRATAEPTASLKAIAKATRCTIVQVKYFMDTEGLPRKRKAERRYSEPSTSKFFRWEDFKTA